jgi:hypothetical protein
MPLVPHTPAAEAADHAELIVALDAGDLSGLDLDRALALAASCAGCGALLGDLAAIRGALPEVPVPPRRRDYRLTDEDAARLRPTGWRRALDWLAAPRSSVRPLATGLATLGVVGLLLTAGLPGFGGGAAMAPSTGERVEASAAGGAGPADNLTTQGTMPEPTAAPAPAATEAAPWVSAPPEVVGAPGATSAPGATAAPAAGGAPDASGPAMLAPGAPSPNADAGRNTTAGADDDAGAKLGTAPAGNDAGLPVGALVSLVLLGSGIALFAARALALRRA